VLFIFLLLTDKHLGEFDYGFTNGVIQGHLDAVDAIQKEFGTCDDRLPGKYLLGHIRARSFPSRQTVSKR
jgi:hypothetical protein